MGADIHMYIEKRTSNGDWACVRNLNETLHSKSLSVLARASSAMNDGFHAYWNLRSRNYALFAALAGVRGDGPEPRGLPEDVSQLIEDEYEGWRGDAHSVSWYLASDFVRIYESVTTPELLPDDEPLSEYVIARMEHGDRRAVEMFLIDKVSLYMNDEDSVNDYRFVFWFDN